MKLHYPNASLQESKVNLPKALVKLEKEWKGLYKDQNLFISVVVKSTPSESKTKNAHRAAEIKTKTSASESKFESESSTWNFFATILLSKDDQNYTFTEIFYFSRPHLSVLRWSLSESSSH